MRDDVGAGTVFQRVMGIDTHMIAGVRACLTFTQAKPSPTIQTTPHHAEALDRSWPPSRNMVDRLEGLVNCWFSSEASYDRSQLKDVVQ
jgi:hypothetical protein